MLSCQRISGVAAADEVRRARVRKMFGNVAGWRKIMRDQLMELNVEYRFFQKRTAALPGVSRSVEGQKNPVSNIFGVLPGKYTTWRIAIETLAITSPESWTVMVKQVCGSCALIRTKLSGREPGNLAINECCN